MSDDAMTLPQVLRAMAENVESGADRMTGIEEYSFKDYKWVKFAHNPPLSSIESLVMNNRIRKAPSYIEVAGVKVPEPMREAPEEGSRYYMTSREGDVVEERWSGSHRDMLRLWHGSVMRTEEGARDRLEAERRLFGKEVE